MFSDDGHIVKHATASTEMNTKDKTTSKFFRVATEGDTADGREIPREWIQQMADAYDPEKYGARIWLEHFRGIFPDGPFKAYGDVLALESRENQDGKLELFAQISPTEELILLNKQRQKIYSSIEVDPNFAKTGQAYLIGLAVTDNPASLGTEMLQFSAQNPAASPLTARKQHPANLFTVAQPVTIEFERSDIKLTDRLKALKNKLFSSEQKANSEISELAEALESLFEHSLQLSAEIDAFQRSAAQLEELTQTVKTLQSGFSKLKAELSEADSSERQRPPATGANVDAVLLTDC